MRTSTKSLGIGLEFNNNTDQLSENEEAYANLGGYVKEVRCDL